MSDAGLNPDGSAWDAARLLAVLRPVLSDPGGCGWFLARALPEDHGLRGVLGECRPVLTEARVVSADWLEFVFAQSEPAWRVLVVAGVAYQRGIGRERRREIGMGAKQIREGGGYDDVVTALIVPRRVARDFDRAWLNGLVTYEAIADRLVEAGDREGGAAVRQACEDQVGAKSAASRSSEVEFWAGYREQARAIERFARLVEPLDGSRAKAGFAARVWLHEARVKVGEIVHTLAGGVVSASLEVSGGEAMVGRMAPELPTDFRVACLGPRLTLSLPVPVLSSRLPTGDQARDVRHAMGSVMRLQQWLASSARHWPRWLPAVPSPDASSGE